MKKHLLLSAFVCCSFILNASDILPNASFENWSFTNYYSPTYYPYSSNLQAYYQQSPYNLERTTDAYHGQYAVKLTTLSTPTGPAMSYFLNTNPEHGDPSSWKNGMPYSEIPTGIRGYFKYNVATADSAIVIVNFRKSGNTIASYNCKIGGVKTDYTLFEFPFNLSQTPDSVIFGAVSSNYFVHENGLAGSTLFLDSVKFTGVTNQPELMNGDFELWTNYQTQTTVDDWNPFQKDQQGVTRTTEAKAGTYAVELTSFLGDENGTPRNSPGYITTGHWSNSCNCNVGGIAYSLLKDTISFWYKYSPTLLVSQPDRAEVSLEFRKNNASFSWEYREINAASEYQYIEIPFENSQAPDSLIISFISSSWNNTNVSFVGSQLIVDEIRFKSQIVYVSTQDLNETDQINILPISSKGVFAIYNPQQVPLDIAIYNISGKLIEAHSGVIQELNLVSSPSGVYFVRLIAENGKTITKRLIKL